MRRLFIICLLFQVSLSYTQTTEDFEDGDFADGNPLTWTPSQLSGSNDFIISGGKLQSNGPSATASLYISSDLGIDFATNDVTWTFKARYDGGAPSSSNFVEVYLMSDILDVSGSPEGYYIKLGESGSTDGIDLFSTSSGTAIISDVGDQIATTLNAHIRVTRTATGEWTLEADASGGDTFSTIGTMTNTDFSSGNFFGFFVRHSSTKNQDFYFDDLIIATTPIPDTTPPTIQSITAISATEVDVLFSENVDQASAETSTNYSLDNGATVASAVADGSNSALVHLTTNSLTNGDIYTVTINNVEDESANVIALDSQDSFEYLVIEEAEVGDIVVNEFYAAPNSESVIPNVEFVELLNVSDKFIQLENWTMSDASGTSGNFTSFKLDPDQYVILTNTGNGASFNSYGDVLEVAGFRALNNGGDDIILTNSLATDIYSITYTSSTSGISTEMINPNGPDYSFRNYGLSTDPDGGTPGVVNSIFDDTPDTTPPTIESIDVFSSTELKVFFSESLQESTANVSTNYTIDGGITVSNVEQNSENNQQVTLTVSELVSGDIRTLTINNVADLSGNSVAANSTVDFEYILTEEAIAGDIVINEYYAAPNSESAIPNVEFIEIFNRSDKFIDLENWTFSDQSSSSSPFQSFIIRPDSFLIITETDNGVLFDSFGDWLEVGNFPALNNGGDSIIISNSTSLIIHELGYSHSTSGITTELINPNGPDYSFRNYGLSTSIEGGTPGGINSIFDDTPDTTAPAIDSVIVVSQTELEIHFNEPLEETSSEIVSNYSIDGGIAVSIAERDESNNVIVYLTVSALVSGEIRTLTTTGVTDLSGNPTASVEFDFRYIEIEEAVEGDVVINEFYANPNEESTIPDREFIELFNRSNKYINVEGWIYSDVSDTSSTFPSFILEPDSFLILTTTGAVSLFGEYGDAIGVGSFRSLSTSDQIVITNSNEIVIHQIIYSEATSGITTELINPNGPDYSFRNYGLSTSIEGGTPGKINSIFDDTPDTTSPAIDTVIVVSQTELEIHFNEPLEETSSEAVSNYSIDGGITVSNAERDESDNAIVYLTVSALVSGEIRTLTATGVTDLSGNPTASEEFDFRYIEIEEAVEGDVVINEFYANPNEESTIPDREFIELFNRSNKYINVEGWIYSDASDTSSTFPSFVLEPDSFLILTTSGAVFLFEEYGEVIGVGSFRSLSTSDQIVITNANEIVVHKIAYSGAISGITTELINPNGPDYSFRNYGLSTSIEGGTPGGINSIFDDTPDTTAPAIEDVKVISATELNVVFNEPLDEMSSENSSNYTIDLGTTIVSAHLYDTANNIIQLMVSDLPPATIGILTINNLTDLSGNSIADNSTIEFEYLEIEQASSGDILINEFLADPVDNNDDFIELWNVSNKFIDLRNWKIRDNAATSVGLSSFVIRPNQYVIIYDKDATVDYSSLGNAISIPSLTLNNTNDQIELLAPDSTSIAFVSYIDQPEEGISSELINPNDPCITELSYGASISVSGNTAGNQNSIFNDSPDTSSPMITSYNFEDALTIHFSETMNAESLQIGAYEIEGLTISEIIVNGTFPNSVDIFFNENLTLGTLYELMVSNVIDCWGNEMNPTTLSFGIGRKPFFNEVIITEIMADPDPAFVLPDREYIEIYNVTENILTLEGMILADPSSSTNFPAISINPFSYTTLTTTTAASEFGNGAVGVSGFPSLSNSGEQLVLSMNEELIFSVTYDVDWHSTEENKIGGVSLEMIDITNPCAEQNNWTSSTASNRGTPSQSNSVAAFVPDNFPPEVIDVVALTQDTIRIDFNEKINPTMVDLVSNTIEPQVSIQQVNANHFNSKSLFLILDEPLQESILYNLNLSNVSDCNGNASGDQQFDFALPSIPDANQVLLSEILFNPYTNGVDFVELYNNSDQYLDLKNWQLANLADGAVANQREISKEQLVFEPRSFIALSTNPDVLFTNYPKGNRGNFFQMTSLPTYANDEGTVVLLNQDSLEVESFSYSDDFHYGLLNSVDGVSLERISYTSANDQNNWRSASSTVGFATPGYQNSQSFEAQLPKGTIEIEPKVFLPGNSGSGRDFTLVSYQVETAGQFANVNVYDQTGRLIKTLAEGVLLANSGFFRWDGTTNIGGMARLGYYVVLFEVYDSSGNTEMMKETVVVGRDF